MSTQGGTEWATCGWLGGLSGGHCRRLLLWSRSSGGWRVEELSDKSLHNRVALARLHLRRSIEATPAAGRQRESLSQASHMHHASFEREGPQINGQRESRVRMLHNLNKKNLSIKKARLRPPHIDILMLPASRLAPSPPMERQSQQAGKTASLLACCRMASTAPPSMASSAARIRSNRLELSARKASTCSAAGDRSSAWPEGAQRAQPNLEAPFQASGHKRLLDTSDCAKVAAPDAQQS